MKNENKWFWAPAGTRFCILDDEGGIIADKLTKKQAWDIIREHNQSIGLLPCQYCDQKGAR